MVVQREIRADDRKLLTAAIMKVAVLWGMTDDKLGAALSLPSSTIKQLRLEEAELDQASDGFENAQHLLRLARSLGAMLGSDESATRTWFSTYNVNLAARPIDLIENGGGLSAVGQHVEGHLNRV